MQSSAHQFSANAKKALADQELQRALSHVRRNFIDRRRAAAADLPEFDALREHARKIKEHAIDNLSRYLTEFEAKVLDRGGKVHWCATSESARETILDICRKAGAKTVTKGKTMVGEEIGINDFLERNGIEPIETDLGEYIIQLRGETPSHILAPAVHVTKRQVEKTFREAHRDLDPRRNLEEPSALLAEARERLRDRFIAADVGITGANFLVAETGSTIIVTNEGNGDLTQLLPRVHIALTSIEKVVPTLDDVSTLLRVLARSATGQEMSVYTTFSTGPKRQGDRDGPDEFHVVILDNGRSKLLGTEFEDMLRCIRCGACLNHCPVYHAIGGHAYGWVYSGPIGAIFTPAIIGHENALPLPNASSLCGRCESVCPVGIPIPSLLRKWREREWARSLTPKRARVAIAVWAWMARRPKVYRLASRIALRLIKAWAAGQRSLRRAPLASSWCAARDLPVPQGRTFHELYRGQQQ